MGYFIRYWKKQEDETLEDGIMNVPGDISEQEAEELLKKNQAVKWYVPPEVENEYEKLKKKKEE